MSTILKVRSFVRTFGGLFESPDTSSDSMLGVLSQGISVSIDTRFCFAVCSRASAAAVAAGGLTAEISSIFRSVIWKKMFLLGKSLRVKYAGSRPTFGDGEALKGSGFGGGQFERITCQAVWQLVFCNTFLTLYGVLLCQKVCVLPNRTKLYTSTGQHSGEKEPLVVKLLFRRSVRRGSRAMKA
jgi:hypothetical protein